MKRVLVVEDDNLIMRMYQQMLGERYEVLTARDGEAALKLIGEASPDLVFLDLNLPEMSGRQVLMQMKDKGLTEKIPVIVLTNEGDELTRVRVMESGAREVLTKANLELGSLVELAVKYLGE